jgi:hypothetical protein
MKVITKWGYEVDHAMTIVGYDDEIRYDFNGDGLYTNDIDINHDNIIDMRDWEIGGLIVANSWGDSWGNFGKCYMMYKLLAESNNFGGIWNNTVYGIKVRTDYSPFLTYKITIKHNSRQQIRITAGSSPDINAIKPSFTMSFPIFNYQGGNLNMPGGSNNSGQTIEIGLDVTPLLSNLQNNQAAKFFLMVDENDPDGKGLGEIVSFSAISYTNGVDETLCSKKNIVLNNNSRTMLSIIKSVSFNPISITSNQLPTTSANIPYSQQLSAIGGTNPYKWNLKIDYSEQTLHSNFPEVKDHSLSFNNNDDGVAEVPLGFPFMFYGKYYDKVYVSTDGSILFDNEFKYVRTYDNLKANKAITVFGADLQIYDGDGVWYEGDQYQTTFYWNVSEFEKPGSNIKAAITIFANGSIYFYYGEGITNDITLIAGVSNGDNLNFTIESNTSSNEIPKKNRIKFITTDFPIGMQLDENGLFNGTPIVNNRTYNLKFIVYDYNNISNEKTIPFIVGHNEVSDEDISLNYFPNPFTDYIIFSAYNITNEEKRITIDIFNSRGVLLRNICNNVLLSKNIDLIWNGIDNNDNQVNSGIYFARIKINNTIKYKKIIML